MLRSFWLFLVMCGVNGLFTFGGSVLGSALGKTGLFGGAVLGGLIGVALAGLGAQSLRLIDKGQYILTVIGGSIGFAVACVVATNNLHTPVIPILSISLVGIGAIIGSRLSPQSFPSKGEDA